MNPWAGCVQVRLVRCARPGSTLAIGSITLGEPWQGGWTPWLSLDDVRVVSNREGQPWVSLPRRQREDGQWHSIVLIDDADLLAEIRRCVLDEFRRLPK